ncbi:MAG: tRNA (5-methylaminomethyl-2-thiouridine)(34)-methyltransferase MnmD [Bacteroidota bacterium]|nr:tRNA (5-methylaminomethyl-2-thiouridine)(34)-methyltransferase MnmD [Bacteroidota bacterium]
MGRADTGTPQIIISEDGSHTLYLPECDETYHSRHGAIQESKHVFIEAGLKEISLHKKNVNLLEIGFGTGLNALLSYLATQEFDVRLHYLSLEPYPLTIETINLLNYPGLLGGNDVKFIFQRMHNTPWDEAVLVSGDFILEKRKIQLQAFETQIKFDLVYYDAFAPRVQPEVWTEKIFTKTFGMMSEEGVLVTYCAKGNVRRAMISSGFKVEKLNGPPGKREMLRARK